MLSFTILTTAASAATNALHARMPVILQDDGFADWLNRGDVRMPADIDRIVEFFPVSAKVNSPRYDAPDCIAPLAAPMEERQVRLALKPEA